MPIKGDINTLAGIGMTNNRVWWQKKREKEKIGQRCIQAKG